MMSIYLTHKEMPVNSVGIRKFSQSISEFGFVSTITYSFNKYKDKVIE